LESFDALADINERSPCRGPIPVLFARDPGAVAEALNERPEKVHVGKQIGNNKPEQIFRVNTVGQDMKQNVLGYVIDKTTFRPTECPQQDPENERTPPG
jgi:hypothetical protein